MADEQRDDAQDQTDDDVQDDKGGATQDAPPALTAALRRVKKELKEAKAALSQLPEGYDPDAVRELIEEKQRREQEDAEKKGQWDKLAAKMREQAEKEKQTWEQERTQLEADLANELIDARVAILLQKPGLEGSAKLLLPHVRANTRVVKGENGKRQTVVVDEEGEARINAKTGEPMTIEELLIEMRDSDDFAGAFKGSGAAGGGAPGRGAAGGGVRSKYRTKADFNTVAERVAFIGEHGQEAYLALPQS